jgi:hypothetical protein
MQPLMWKIAHSSFAPAQLKGMVSRDGVPTFLLGPKQSAAYRFYTYKVAHQKDMMLQTGGLSMYNGLLLDFTMLWKTALKCVPRTMACRGI